MNLPLGGFKYWLRWSLILLLGIQSQWASAQISEAELRTAFVFNFLKFIQWPHITSANAAESSLNLCVIGADAAIRQYIVLVERKPVQKRQIKVLFLDHASDVTAKLSSCHLAYVPQSGAKISLPNILPSGLLLVVDEPLVNDDRVGIALVRSQNDNIEFWINDSAIANAGVQVSSQLMKLAKNQRNRAG